MGRCGHPQAACLLLAGAVLGTLALLSAAEEVASREGRADAGGRANSLAPRKRLSPEFMVREGRIVDELGRERLFHGLNVVVKGAPWQPQTDAFDPLMSLADEDIELLQGFGMNVVRLGVMWPGVEPAKGTQNATYLASMQALVRRLAAAGIYTLVEFHQDVFGGRFCGEGVPAWLLDDVPEKPLGSAASAEEGWAVGSSVSAEIRQLGDTWQGQSEQRSSSGRKLLAGADAVSASWPCFLRGTCNLPWEYSATFPEPISKRFRVDFEEEDRGERMSGAAEPTVGQCLKHPWGAYHFSYAVARAFQDLYNNRWGWADQMARYWATVAETFRDEEGVLGYELFNEPWVGDQYSDPFLLLPGHADKKNLQPFYDILQAAIWAADDRHLLFFESLTFDNLRNGFDRVPGSESLTNMSVLSYHYYRPPNLGVQQAFAQRAKEAERLRCGSFLTEFGIPAQASSKVNLQKAAQAGAFVLKAYQDAGLESRLPGSWRQALLQEEGGGGEVEELEAGSNPRRGSLHWGMRDAEEVMAAADSYVQSWIGWEYKAFINKTGSNYGPFNEDGSINVPVAKALSRTYPQAVAGRIHSFSFNTETSAFALSYTAASTADRGKAAPGNDLANTSEIWLHREYYYPEGILVLVEPKSVVVKEVGNVVLLVHGPDVAGLLVNVTITAAAAASQH